MELTLAIAQDLVDAALEEARRIDTAMCVTVVDAGGHVIAKVRMDHATVISGRIADDKAYTAAGLGMATGDLADLVREDGPLFGLPAADGGRIITFGGGFPLRGNGRLLGAIGVSGGAVDQDIEVARAALRKWHETS